ncbi:MAG: sugar ABC transporter substrate-binding protein [Hungatella sp.]|jgi:ribose transport system substrate-binding protein|nr:sugar ABC transporter substrate-binding protein [Hungatella sp.]
MKKRILTTILALGLMASMISGCGAEKSAETNSSTEVASGKYKFSVVLKTLNSEYWGQVAAGVKDAAAKYGVEYSLLGAPDETNITDHVSKLESELTSKPQVLITALLQESETSTLARYPEVPVIFVDSNAEYPAKKAFIGTGNVAAGIKGGEYIGSKLKPGDKVLLVGGQSGESTSEQRLEGFRTGLESKGITDIDVAYGGNVANVAMPYIEDALSRTPDLKAILSMNDDMAMGALQALKAAGRDDVLVLGFDATSAAVEAIAAGTMTASIAQQPYLMGYQAIEQAIKVADGEEIQVDQVVSVTVVDADNVEGYKK